MPNYKPLQYRDPMDYDIESIALVVKDLGIENIPLSQVPSEKMLLFFDAIVRNSQPRRSLQTEALYRNIKATARPVPRSKKTRRAK